MKTQHDAKGVTCAILSMNWITTMKKVRYLWRALPMAQVTHFVLPVAQVTGNTI